MENSLLLKSAFSPCTFIVITYMFNFIYIRNYQTSVPKQLYHFLYSHQQCVRVPVAPYSQPIVNVDFRILVDIKCCYGFSVVCLVLAVLGLCRCALGFSGGDEWWLLLSQRVGSRRIPSSHATWPQQLHLVGLAVVQHVGSSRTRHRTRVPCIRRQILTH